MSHDPVEGHSTGLLFYYLDDDLQLWWLTILHLILFVIDIDWYDWYIICPDIIYWRPIYWWPDGGYAEVTGYCYSRSALPVLT